MRALVIGGTGFIGLNLVDELLAQGARVRVTRRKRSATILLQGRAVELVDASLEETGKLADAMSGCDVAFLAGAYYPRYSLDLEASLVEGVRGVRAACEAALASGVRRLVYTSTIATLASAPAGRPADERDLATERPTGSVYRTVKWAMEREVDLARRRGLDVVTMMPAGCIGPWDVRLGTGSVIVGVVRGLLPWWVDGIVNLVDVGDVARAHVAAATRAVSDRYCLPGHDVRVGWLLRHLAERYGGQAPTRRLTADEARAQSLADEREAAPGRRRVAVPRELVDMATSGQRVSGARAHAQLGVERTPLDASLDRAHAWFLRHGYLPRTGGPTITTTTITEPRTDDPRTD
jgi:dihydroflavonol-4-reductase